MSKSIRQINAEIRKKEIRAMITRNSEEKKRLLSEISSLENFREMIKGNGIETAAFMEGDHVARVMPATIETL